MNRQIPILLRRTIVNAQAGIVQPSNPVYQEDALTICGIRNIAALKSGETSMKAWAPADDAPAERNTATALFIKEGMFLNAATVQKKRRITVVFIRPGRARLIEAENRRFDDVLPVGHFRFLDIPNLVYTGVAGLFPCLGNASSF